MRTNIIKITTNNSGTNIIIPISIKGIPIIAPIPVIVNINPTTNATNPTIRVPLSVILDHLSYRKTYYTTCNHHYYNPNS